MCLTASRGPQSEAPAAAGSSPRSEQGGFCAFSLPPPGSGMSVRRRRNANGDRPQRPSLQGERRLDSVAVWTLSQERLADAVGRARGRKALRRDGRPACSVGPARPRAGALCCGERERQIHPNTAESRVLCVSSRTHRTRIMKPSLFEMQSSIEKPEVPRMDSACRDRLVSKWASGSPGCDEEDCLSLQSWVLLEAEGSSSRVETAGRQGQKR